MKKFTKGCLITALVLFVFGCAFYGICGFMGGFGQLKERDIMSSNGTFSIGVPGTWWGYHIGLFSFWDDDWEDWDDDLSHAVNLIEQDENAQTAYISSEIKSIDIELGGCSLVIAQSQDDRIWIENRSDFKTLKYGMKNGTFRLYNSNSFRFWNHNWNSNNWNSGSVYLYLPEGLDLRSINIEMGAGNMESIALAATDIDLEAGAGSFTIEALSGSEISVSVGAGGADIDTILANSLSLEAGAGSITVDDMNVGKLDVEAAAGPVELTGEVSGDADIECAAGSVDISLRAMQNDFDYEIECSVGSVTIGHDEYSGLATERSIYNGAGREMNIECAAGSVTVGFSN
ncbi:MAG: DUF4097 domain-containing protein [Ruminococcus sp.]|nr:DUF4097 domain-containing protein [Ruminococcus sp.]